MENKNKNKKDVQKKGKLITLEGIEKTGKTILSNLLMNYFSKKGVKSYVRYEPGDTSYGNIMRHILMNPNFVSKKAGYILGFDEVNKKDLNEKLCSRAELFGYLFSRAQFYQTKVKQMLDKGKLVILDRSGDSSVAYQGYGNHRGDSKILEFIKMANEYAMGDINIDRTYLIDIGIKEMNDRTKELNDRTEKSKNSSEFDTKKDVIESRGDEYFNRVRRGYLDIALENQERFLIMPGLRPIEDIFLDIVRDIEKYKLDAF